MVYGFPNTQDELLRSLAFVRLPFKNLIRSQPNARNPPPPGRDGFMDEVGCLPYLKGTTRAEGVTQP